jgi:hypothetical protein
MNEVKSMLEHPGWKQFVEPLLDQMIVDVIGGKENGVWLNMPDSLKEKNMTLDEIKYLLGYKTALIDFAQRVQGLVESKDE